MSQTGPPIPLVAGGTVQVPASLGPGQVIAGVVLANLSPFALQVQSGVGQTWVPPYDAMPFAQTQLGTIAVTAVSVGPGYSGTASILPTYYGQGETLPPETPLTAAALAAAIQGIVSVAVTGGTIDVLDGDVSVVGGQGGVVNVSTQTPPVSVGVLTLDGGQTSVQLTAPVNDAWTGIVVDVNPPAYNPGTPVSFVVSAACSNPGAGNTPQVTLPASAQVGDTGVSFVTSQAPNAASCAGWTQVCNSADSRLQVFARVLVAGDSLFTFTCTAGNYCSVDLSVYRGATAVGPSGTGTSLIAPSVNANASGDWLVCLWGSHCQVVPSGSGTFSLTAAGGMTSDLAVGGNTSSLAAAREIARLALGAGGATGTKTATFGYSGTGTGYASIPDAAAVILYGPNVPNPLPYTVTVAVDGALGIVQRFSEQFSVAGQIVLPVPGNVTGSDIIYVLVTAQAAPAGNIEVAAVAALLGSGAQYVFTPPGQPLPTTPAGSIPNLRCGNINFNAAGGYIPVIPGVAGLQITVYAFDLTLAPTGGTVGEYRAQLQDTNGIIVGNATTFLATQAGNVAGSITKVFPFGILMTPGSAMYVALTCAGGTANVSGSIQFTQE